MGNLPCCNQEQQPARPELKFPRKRLPGTEKITKHVSFTDHVSTLKTIPDQKPVTRHIILSPTISPIPSKLGGKPQNYQSVKYLGKGSFGCVVLAEQKQTHQRYAMKIIDKQKIKEDNVLQCQLIRLLGNHPFFASIKQIFQNDNNVYIIMEYFPLGDLYFYLRKKEIHFTEDDVRNILVQIIVGLQYLHNNGIVYRELKPENILVTNQGHIKFTDYGFSKIINDRPFISTFIGTLEYMAPQALKNQFGQKADVWGLGVLMYELMFKQNPLAQEGSGETDQTDQADHVTSFEQKIQKNLIVEKINSKIGHMSLDFRDLLLGILQKDPNNRIGLEQMRSHVFFKDTVWSQVEARINEPPLKQIVQKHDIKYRDPSLQPNIRKTVTKQLSLNQNYQINLFEFRNSH